MTTPNKTNLPKKLRWAALAHKTYQIIARSDDYSICSGRAYAVDPTGDFFFTSEKAAESWQTQAGRRYPSDLPRIRHITSVSVFTGKAHTMAICLSNVEFAAWEARSLRVVEVGHLTNDEKRFLVSGITPLEWATEMGKLREREKTFVSVE